MQCVIKASKLSRINDRKLPDTLKVLHYVYRDRYYNYRRDRDKIIVNNEVSMFRFDILPDLDLSRYAKDVIYFLFSNSLYTNIRAEIESGSAQGLTCAEACATHQYLLKGNMICVFAEIHKKYSLQLFNKLTCALEDANKRQKPKHIVNSAMAAKEEEAYISWDKDQSNFQKAFLFINLFTIHRQCKKKTGLPMAIRNCSPR